MPRHTCLHSDSRLDCAHRVVVVDDRGAEEGKDSVSYQIGNRSLMCQHRIVDNGKVAVEQPQGGVRWVLRSKRRITAEVCEHGGHPPMVAAEPGRIGWVTQDTFGDSVAAIAAEYVREPVLKRLRAQERADARGQLHLVEGLG